VVARRLVGGGPLPDHVARHAREARRLGAQVRHPRGRLQAAAARRLPGRVPRPGPAVARAARPVRELERLGLQAQFRRAGIPPPRTQYMFKK